MANATPDLHCIRLDYLSSPIGRYLLPMTAVTNYIASW